MCSRVLFVLWGCDVVMKEFALSGIWPQGARLPYMECDEDQTRSGVSTAFEGGRSSLSLPPSSPQLSRARRNLWMSQQPAAAKPTLQGVRIRARKGAVKAHAKHEPTSESMLDPRHYPTGPSSCPHSL